MRRGDVVVAASAVAFGLTIPLGKLALDGGAGAWTAVAVRFLVGGLLLARFTKGRAPGAGERRAVLVSSTALLAGYVLLALGLDRTTSTAAAFISYLLVVIVPLLSAVILKRLPAPEVGIGIVLATAGLLVLTGGVDEFGAGELLCLGCAVAFSVHVLLVGHYAPGQEPVRFACGQLLAVGVAAAPVGVALDGMSADGLGWLVAGGAVGCIALTLQLVGQQTVSPTRTSLLLMIDPVVAAAAGYGFLGERVGWRGATGCVLILLGVAAPTLLTGRSTTGEDNDRYG